MTTCQQLPPTIAHRVPPPALRWVGDARGHLVLLDQTLLPNHVQETVCRDLETLVESIRSLRVRGAPAIGIAAAYGVCLGLQATGDSDEVAFFRQLDSIVARLAESRPTAVNLFWALDRMRRRAEQLRGTPLAQLRQTLLDEASAIHEEDRATCRAIGRYGAELFQAGWGVLTHCNAGGLATAEYGTALSVVFTCQDQGKPVQVFVDETRPLLQGARLTAWELLQRGVPTTLICDSMAAQVMKEGKVQAVIVGADRIAANGDTANKIGTYGLAVAARAHRIPFYVAAPSNTFDLSLRHGEQIPIEQRDGGEITHFRQQAIAPAGVLVYNPAFDVTPAEYIRAIITERGLISPVTVDQIAAVLTSRAGPA